MHQDDGQQLHSSRTDKQHYPDPHPDLDLDPDMYRDLIGPCLDLIGPCLYADQPAAARRGGEALKSNHRCCPSLERILHPGEKECLVALGEKECLVALPGVRAGMSRAHEVVGEGSRGRRVVRTW